ncbi:Hypothetical protein CINCED_3A015222 [Cinara cedri]|uniref:Uncharacterized protein n=1 Tax=Cinara cedri TaxID=506608 RepID=A0A5E4NR19_9HEMI|nr:Hypothetical protein CINCED_3A015222 [Cinara cedri]
MSLELGRVTAVLVTAARRRLATGWRARRYSLGAGRLLTVRTVELGFRLGKKLSSRISGPGAERPDVLVHVPRPGDGRPVRKQAGSRRTGDNSRPDSG